MYTDIIHCKLTGHEFYFNVNIIIQGFKYYFNKEKEVQMFKIFIVEGHALSEVFQISVELTDVANTRRILKSDCSRVKLQRGESPSKQVSCSRILRIDVVNACAQIDLLIEPRLTRQ